MKINELQSLLFQEEDIKWQTLLLESVNRGKLDPWDVDLSILSQEYIKILQGLKELNFKLSGKVILAAAILLKLKTDRLGLNEFISLTESLDQEEVPEEMLDDDLEMDSSAKPLTDKKIQKRVPGVRVRKVTVYELMSAIKRAMSHEERRLQRIRDIKRKIPPPPKIRPKKIDIFDKIEDLFSTLVDYFKKNKKIVKFSHLVPSNKKKDIVWTLLPLMHLANSQKITLKQKEAFGEIYVTLLTTKRLRKDEVVY
jgi:segregation and condensation protein A